MEAAAKTFFSSPCFAVVGASQESRKFGFRGKYRAFCAALRPHLTASQCWPGITYMVSQSRPSILGILRSSCHPVPTLLLLHPQLFLRHLKHPYPSSLHHLSPGGCLKKQSQLVYQPCGFNQVASTRKDLSTQRPTSKPRWEATVAWAAKGGVYS